MNRQSNNKKKGHTTKNTHKVIAELLFYPIKWKICGLEGIVVYVKQGYPKIVSFYQLQKISWESNSLPLDNEDSRARHKNTQTESKLNTLYGRYNYQECAILY